MHYHMQQHFQFPGRYGEWKDITEYDTYPEALEGLEQIEADCKKTGRRPLARIIGCNCGEESKEAKVISDGTATQSL